MGRVCSLSGEEEECIQDAAGKARTKEITRKPPYATMFLVLVFIVHLHYEHQKHCCIWWFINITGYMRSMMHTPIIKITRKTKTEAGG
jgi:hypothetical protein